MIASSGTLDGLSAGIEYGTGGPIGWLSATLSGATTPATRRQPVRIRIE